MSGVRRMTSEDAGPVADLMQEMQQRTEHPAKVDRWAASSSVREMLEQDLAIGYVLQRSEYFTGAILGLITPDWLCGDATASVMFWYTRAHEFRGLGLFQAFQKESKKRGAKRIFAAAPVGPNSERLSRIFQGNRMRPVETWWFKHIGEQ